MTGFVTALTHQKDSHEAGLELGRAIRAGFNGAAADAVMVFACADHDYPRLLAALAAEAGTQVIAGSSSAGEFTHSASGEGGVSALGLRSENMRFAVGLGRNITGNPAAAAAQVVAAFGGLSGGPLPYRSALVMTDALAGYTDALVEALTIKTGGNYRFFGGGAGDDGRFQKTHVFAGTEAVTDAVVALEILSAHPLGVGVSHGWVPAAEGLRVTEIDGSRLIGLNGVPAVEAFEDHAEATGQPFDRQDPLPFFLHNILGIRSGDSYKLRVPLGVSADGSVSCAAALPAGAIVHIMKTSEASAVLAAERATRDALAALGGRRPGAALVFDCVATRLRLGRGFHNELNACAELLKPAGFVGCNTYGQIARAEGQFSGFHNCTAVVCVLPE
ncbi:MAG: hypothetical protein JWO70_1424 [Betaproteobacteria bacterium]|nr:hypothetical protein [Betaproteobacteria bacterium]